jgi:hypothetical protein
VRELGKFKLDLLGVQEVRWEKGGTVQAEGYKFFVEREMGIISEGQIFSYIRDSYQWLGEWSLLVIGCRI